MRGKLTNCRTCCQDCMLSGTELMPKSCVSYKQQITNADRIRAMTDEELAKLLINGCADSDCSDQTKDEYGPVDCFRCRLKWLQQPCEDSPNGQKG